MLHVVIFAFGISVGTFLGAYIANKEFQGKVNALFNRNKVKSEDKPNETEVKK